MRRRKRRYGRAVDVPWVRGLSWPMWRGFVLEGLRRRGIGTKDRHRIFERYSEELRQRWVNDDDPTYVAGNFAAVWEGETLR